MSVDIKVDLREFNQAMRELLEAKKRDVVEFTNQRLLNVVHWTLDNLLARNPDNAMRAKIKTYMRSTPSGYAESIENKELRRRKLNQVNAARTIAAVMSGRFLSRKRKRKFMKLELRHLIAQGQAKRENRKGLYGEEMKRAAGRTYYRATGAIGYFRVVYRSIVERLNPLCKFKVPYSLTKSLRRWPRTEGFGTAEPATQYNPESLLRVGVNVSDRTGLGREVFVGAIEKAFKKEESEMRTQLEKTIAKNLQKVSAK